MGFAVCDEGALLMNPSFKTCLMYMSYALRAENRHYSWWINQSSDFTDRDEYTCFYVRSVEKQSHKQLISLPQQRGLINWAAHLLHPHRRHLSSPFCPPQKPFSPCSERLFAISFSHFSNVIVFLCAIFTDARNFTCAHARHVHGLRTDRNTEWKYFLTQASQSQHLHL